MQNEIEDGRLPLAPGKRRWEQDAVVLQNGHIDRITGPRCMVQMAEGPKFGLYMIGRTESILAAGALVWRDEITGRTRLRDSAGLKGIAERTSHAE